MTNQNNTLIENRLLYRRQYFIGPEYIDRFQDWNKIKIGDAFVTYHPDLEVTISKNKNRSLLMLGFAFDYNNYKYTNQEIVKNILSTTSSFDEVVKATYDLAGRWALLYREDSDIKIFHDPGGLRQIYFTKYEGETWCSAQPHILADVLNLNKKDNTDISKYLNSKGYQLNERCWIGKESIYESIYHLQCNHYLDFDNGDTQRYWPIQTNPHSNLSDVVENSSFIIKELLKAAKYRYNTSQIITAGWDTRLLLAASKRISKDQEYFIHKLPIMDSEHEDISIPSRVANNFDLNFKVINCAEYNDEFDSILTKNVENLQSDVKKYQHFSYLTEFENKLIISGNVSPLIKEQYHTPNKISVQNLARLINLHNSKLALGAISEWLNEIKLYSSTKNIKIDIGKYFYWEIRFGWWAPMYNAELDIAAEEFSPYNCRDLINIMISLPKNYLKKPDFILYNNIIKKIWPELMEFPVNPVSHRKYYRDNIPKIFKLQSLLRKVGLYKPVRYFYRKFK